MKSFLIIILSFLTKSYFAQSETIQLNIGGTPSQIMTSAKLNDSTMVFVSSSNGKYFLTCMKNDNSISWSKEIGVYYFTSNLKCVDQKIYLSTYGSGNQSDFYLIKVYKFDINGNILWEKKWHSQDIGWLYQSDLLVDNEQNVYIPFGYQSAIKICKLDSSGNNIYQKAIAFDSLPNQVRFYGIEFLNPEITENSDIVFFSNQQGNSDNVVYGRVKNNLDPVWIKKYKINIGNRPSSIISLNNNRFFISGSALDTTYSNWCIYNYVLDSTGIIKYKYHYANDIFDNALMQPAISKHILQNDTLTYSDYFGNVFQFNQQGEMIQRFGSNQGGVEYGKFMDRIMIYNSDYIYSGSKIDSIKCGMLYIENLLPEMFSVRTDSVGTLMSSITYSTFDSIYFGINSLPNASASLSILCNSLNLKEITKQENDFIYPNPVNNYLQFNNVNDKCNFEIIDIHGTVLLFSKTNTKEIDVSFLNQGLYFIRFSPENEQSFTVSFIKN